MDEKDSYRTIRKTSSGLFRDRGSKFLSFAYPVHSTEEIKEILADMGLSFGMNLDDRGQAVEQEVIEG